MQQPFALGEIVKLNDYGLKVYRSRLNGWQKRSGTAWAGRPGVVQRYKGTGEVIVAWQGRSSLEAVPLKILEPV